MWNFLTTINKNLVIAIPVMMALGFIFGVLFALTGRKWKSLPLWAWLIFGILPIGLDGVSQLLSQWTAFLGWIPYRESTPFLRTLTGFLFGFTTAWFGYPLIEEAMADTRRIMKTKKSLVESKESENAAKS